MLSHSSMPRRQSVSSHGSPIPPSSPILEEEHTGEQYKICNYRSAVGQTTVANSSVGMNTAFFPSGHCQPAASLQMHCATGMGYHNTPSAAAAAAAAMCPPTSMYTSQDAMYANSTSSFMWK